MAVLLAGATVLQCCRRRYECYKEGVAALPTGVDELPVVLQTGVEEMSVVPHTGVDVLPTGDEVLQVRFVMLCAGEVSRRSSVRRRSWRW
jgi:hypothetical protein